jgi:hypothetical protein
MLTWTFILLGWWWIGIELNLSPFNVAKAFNASLFSNVNSAAGSIGVVKKAGDLRLRLGEVEVLPSAGSISECEQGLQTSRYSRIGIDESIRVTRPAKGARFVS